MDLRRLVGLYVHIPFCSVKCFYCDFTAFAGQGRSVARYLGALAAEARLKSGRVPDTLYVGGGTPSELSAPQIGELFDLIARAYPQSRFQESTFEANPESTTAEKLSVLRSCGVTRLSLGAQTLDDALLKGIGRRHTAADLVDVYRQARTFEGWSISIDLMYGLPGQTVLSFLKSLDDVLALEPEHLSLYGLQVEDRTLFSKRGVEPEDDACRAMYEDAIDRLNAAGYRHYEISNFAKPGFESKHNRIYWHDGEYVGLGCGAASFLDGVRSTSIDRLIPYCEAVEAGRLPTAQEEWLSGRDKLGETAMLGLRLVDGFEPGADIEREFFVEIGRLVERKLIRREGRRLKLTREGVFLANQAFMEFVPPFEDSLKGVPA
ncbi:MAG: radical SAM family heme chaperone HemW [Elusimicrobia bacterium]|nr:radical SAM family heme chaperone HemW [Elusimicrobiota bacterium]